MAATSPAFTVRFKPRMISVPSSAMRACRFLISSIVVSKSVNEVARAALERGSRAVVRSAHAAFKRDADELLGLDGKFHRQFLQDFLDEAVDDQRDCRFFRNAALQAVEELVFGDLRRRRFMLELRCRIFRFDVGHGMSAALVAYQK